VFSLDVSNWDDFIRRESRYGEIAVNTDFFEKMEDIFKSDMSAI
jgi:hypothetical protein